MCVSLIINQKKINIEANFQSDSPINGANDDKLSRTDFSRHLADAFTSWTGEESLVVALNGPWGSGKTSVINLMVNIINEKKDSKASGGNFIFRILTQIKSLIKRMDNPVLIPTVIHYNPWAFSEAGSIQNHFFEQIAKELELKNESINDKKIAKKLRYYFRILDLVPTINSGNQGLMLQFFKLLILIILSFSFYPFLSIINGIDGYFLWISLLYMSIGFVRMMLEKYSNLLDSRSEYRAKSVFEEKKEIEEILRARKRKLLIVIDDIDRLEKTEIRQIFKLIRVNANFPNTIYFLAFDQEVIERSLDEFVGVSGKDYLGKIVNVKFDIPHVDSSKMLEFLDKELKRIIDKLPATAKEQLNNDHARWQVIRESVFAGFFKNIRDVKRFTNGLEFNLSKMNNKSVMEVNLIDFIAIESLRVFEQDLYCYIKNSKDILTQYSRYAILGRDERKDQDEINTRLGPFFSKNGLDIKKMIPCLFPQIGKFIDSPGTYSDGYMVEWSSRLRICSPKNFDAYFSLMPGGTEDGISQFEFESVLNTVDNVVKFEQKLRNFIESGKIELLLKRIYDSVILQEKMLQRNRKNVIIAMTNISDNLVGTVDDFSGNALNLLPVGIILNLLRNSDDPNEKFELLQEGLTESNGLFGVIKTISHCVEPNPKERVAHLDFSKEQVAKLIQMGLDRLTRWDRLNFLEHPGFLYMLYRWKLWGDGKSLSEFLEWINNDDERFVEFVSRLIYLSIDSEPGPQVTARFGSLSTKYLDDFLDFGFVKKRLGQIKVNDDIYNSNQKIFDMVLTYEISAND